MRDKQVWFYLAISSVFCNSLLSIFVRETGHTTIIILLQLVQDLFQLEASQLALARRWLWSQEHENPLVNSTEDLCQCCCFQNGPKQSVSGKGFQTRCAHNLVPLIAIIYNHYWTWTAYFAGFTLCLYNGYC